ncbi:MAG: hypothetical protein HY326_12625 [Chloroflexi bacterium]|nr:hypothetical protein [Chloroflexota bacterium]
MPFYADAADFYLVMRAVFERLAKEDPQILASLLDAALIFRLRFHDPAATIVIDGRSNPPQVAFGEDHAQPDIDLVMSTDTIHQVWLSQRRLRDALFTGAIQARGPLMRALILVPLFRRAEELYPQVLADIRAQS